MTNPDSSPHPTPTPGAGGTRLDFLDATRAFALVLGVVFHASLSFMPVFMGWAVQDVSTSPLVTAFTTVSHAFRMELFFLLAGFLSQRSLHRAGVGRFVRSRLVRIGVPFVLGWLLLRPLIVSGWIMGSASLRGDVDVRAGLLGGLRSLSVLPGGIFTGSHLWFLYYLLLTTALVLTARGLLARAGSWKEELTRQADRLVQRVAGSPWAPLVLAIPTAGALWCMKSWGVDTPDRSLVPHLPALAIYGGFFALGWLLARQDGALARFAKPSLPRWILAGLGIAGILLLGGLERDPGHPRHVAAHVAYALSYGLAMTALVSLTLGVFQRFGSGPGPLTRYLADSSYWMYLVHLPLVVWCQVAVAELPLHWTLKLALVSGTTIGIALLTYDLFVRSTFLGRVLNGRRRERVLTAWVLNGLRAGAGRNGSR